MAQKLLSKLTAYCQLGRFDRSIGIWLLLFPCWWGVALAYPYGGIPPRLFGLFAIGAVVMRGAGCTLNDIVDRNLDAQVERTKTRPLPSGRLNVFEAFAFLGMQLLLGLIILLHFNALTIEVAIAALILVALYPFAKRFTWWPQFFLGLAFNWGALLGVTASTGHLNGRYLVLYFSGIAWTLAYDTIYAHQDFRDDQIAGIKSTARLFADNSKRWVGLFYGVFLAGLVVTGMLNAVTPMFYLTLGVTALACLCLWYRWEPGDPANCQRCFAANRWIGLMVFAALVLGRR